MLEDIVLGRKGSCLAITEPGGGSDVANMQTTATRDGDEWVINGANNVDHRRHEGRATLWCGRARRAARAYAVSRCSLSTLAAMSFSVALRWSARWDGRALLDQATLYFDDCRVPREPPDGVRRAVGFIADYGKLRFLSACRYWLPAPWA